MKSDSHSTDEDLRSQQARLSATKTRNLVYLCDWLPPDFGAVGQYSLYFARQFAENGRNVTLVGLSSTEHSEGPESVSRGTLNVIRLHAALYNRASFLKRLAWTAVTNLRILWRARTALLASHEILFTGSPPFMLHFLAPLNILLRKKLIYRITDFHPECLMAMSNKPPRWLRWVYKLTVFWRRRVSEFEVLGEDQRRRLNDIGIQPARVRVKRDLSPVRFTDSMKPVARPSVLDGYIVLLYSGNFGVAHDYETFVEGYRKHHQEGSGRVALWLNATGTAANVVVDELNRLGLPYYRSSPVGLDDLGPLLLAADAHLITLRDAFVGFVLPSKVYACIESQRPLLFVGSNESDVFLLAQSRLPRESFYHVNVGNADCITSALESIASNARRKSSPLVNSEQSLP